MYEFLSNNYGTAGKKFIEALIKKYSKDDYKILKDNFNKIKSNLQEISSNTVSSYISAVALVTLSDIIVSKEIFGKSDYEDSIKMGEDILKMLDNDKDIDVVEKAYDFIKSYTLANHSNFNGIKDFDQRYDEDDVYGDSYNRYGIYNNNIYYYFPHTLENLLESNGFSFRKTIREFAKRDYILYKKSEDDSKNCYSVQKKYRNKNIRFYAFPMQPAEVKKK